MKYIFTIPALVCFVFLLSIIAPEAHWMLDNLSSFLPQASLGALACALIAPAVKAYGPAIVLAGYAGIFGYISYNAHSAEQGSLTEDYTVLHWNALYLNNDLSAFAEHVSDSELPDLIQIQEFSLAHMQSVESLTSLYPHYKLYPEATSASQGAAIFSKHPITEHAAFALGENGYEFVLSTIIQKEGRAPLGVLSLHTKAPVDENWIQARNTSLNDIIPHLKSLKGKAEHTVLLGDLNIAPYSSVFKSFLKNAELKATTELFSTETWPAYAPRYMRTQIDHVLTGDNIKTSLSVLEKGFGSDHLPIKVKLMLN